MTTSRQPSKLVPLIFDRFDEGSNITVFDAGLAVSETVHFFTPYRCKLHFADLYSEPCFGAQDAGLDSAEIEEQFKSLFTFPEGTRFDVCLFWDFLSYLTSPYLKALNNALRPYLHGGTVAHGFGVLKASTPLKAQQYGLANAEELVIRPAQPHGLQYYPHPQADIEKHLTGFTIGRTLLLAGGQLEMLLNAKP